MKIIKFGAVWCPGCLVMKPRWAKLEEEYKIEGDYHDYDEEEELAKELEIGELLPVAILEDSNGNEIHRFRGEISEKDIRNILEENSGK